LPSCSNRAAALNPGKNAAASFFRAFKVVLFDGKTGKAIGERSAAGLTLR